MQPLSIPQLKVILPKLDEYKIGDDFFICELSSQNPDKSSEFLRLLQHPFCFDGYLCILCLNGRFTVDVNLQHFNIQPGSIFINIPDTITKVDLQDAELVDTQVVMTALSREFMSSIRFDLDRIFNESVRLRDNPCVVLPPGQFRIIREYLVLIRSILQAPLQNRQDIIRGVLSSLVHLLAEIWNDAIATAGQPEDSSVAPRLKQLLNRFLSLVTEYHTQERTVSFYAEKLDLTPKYLSKLIKEASGRGAPDWIDSFVILEAKNMLKYSGLSIKEIVFRLHFPNQSVFYKFFKAHTGLTPSQYRNS